MSGTQKTVNSGHIYEFEGRQYPSVTTILSRTESRENKNRLRNWRANFRMAGFSDAFDYMDYTAVRGTFVHYNILNSLSFPSNLDPDGLPPASKWMHRVEMLTDEVARSRALWEKSRVACRAPMEMEKSYCHPGLGYAGQLDFCGMVKIEEEPEFSMTVMDLKTSKQINDKHIIQVGAYAQLVNSWKPNCVKRGLVVSLHPDKKNAIICNLNETALSDAIEDFNVHLDAFWKIPGVKGEYGL